MEPIIKNVIFDYSVIGHWSWHSMFTADYVSKTANAKELDEYTHNLCMNTLHLAKRFAPENLVLALDGAKNWRVPLYDAYYHTYVDYYKLGPADWVLDMDRVLYRCRMVPSTGTWSTKKMVKKDVTEILPILYDKEKTPCFKHGKTPDTILAEHPGAPKDIRGSSDWEHLKTALPRYKGQRKLSHWKAKTPKDEFRLHTCNLAHNIAAYITTHHGIPTSELRVDTAEGDDICAQYVRNHKNEPVLLVTVDADLEQLFLINRNLIIYNPVKRQFMITSYESAAFKLVCKIMGGDTSDNIKGISFNKRLTVFPFVKFDPKTGDVTGGSSTTNWIQGVIEKSKAEDTKGKYADVFAAIRKNADPAPFKRNMDLVYMERIPVDIKQEIVEGLDSLQYNSNCELTDKDFFIEAKDLLTLEHDVAQDQKQDREENIF